MPFAQISEDKRQKIISKGRNFNSTHIGNEGGRPHIEVTDSFKYFLKMSSEFSS